MWDNMQLLVLNLKPAADQQREPKTPIWQRTPDLFQTPEARGPSQTKTGADASPDDMVSTPDFASPLQMGNFLVVLADVLTPLRTPLPKVGRTSDAHSPSMTCRKVTDPFSRGVKWTPNPEASPSLREMPDSDTSNASTPSTEEPEPASEQRSRKVVATPSPGCPGRHVGESLLRRSLRNKGAKPTP